MNKFFSKLKSVSPAVKSSVVYTISNVVSKGLIIITTPIFTRIMLADQIGVVNLYTSWYSMLCVIASLALTSGGFQVAMKEYAGKRDEYQSSVLTLTTLVALLFVVIFLISPGFWSDILEMPIPAIGLMLFGFFVFPARDFWLMRQRYEFKYKLSGVIMIGSAVFASLISILFVSVANAHQIEETGLARLFGNYSIIYGVAFILFIYIFVKGRTFYNKEYWLFSLKLSIPLIGNSIATQILNVSDRVMISTLIGNREVGIYGTLYTISTASQLIWSAINASFVPYLFENIDKPYKRRKIKSITNGFMISYAVIAILISLLAPEIIRVLATDEYMEAVYMMPPVAAGIFMISLSNLYSNVLIYHRSTKSVMIASSIAAILNVGLNYIGINRYGYMAAAYTTLLCYVVMAVFQCLVSNRVHRKLAPDDQGTVYENNKILTIAGIMVVSCFGVQFLYRFNVLRYIIILLIICLCFIFKEKLLSLVKETKNK